MRIALGKYRVSALLGQGGGGGVVYLANRGWFGPEVAVKVPGPLAQHSNIQGLIRELAVHRQLNHPRIVKVLGSGQVDRLLYFVLEYAPGGTLHHLLAGGRRPTSGQVVAVIQQVAQALDYAHHLAVEHDGVVLHGIIHRDIKPQNIYLDGQGGVKLGDFGLAKPFEGGYTITTGGFPGTPPYMSPEQFMRTDGQGNRVRLTPASDVWQLAVVAYEMLTGRRPFGPYSDEDDTITIMERIIRETPLHPKQANPLLDDRTCEVLLKALNKDPKKRPGAMEFAHELEAALGAAPQALPASAPEELKGIRKFSGLTSVPGGLPGLAPARVGLRMAIASLVTLLVILMGLVWAIIYFQAHPGSGDVIIKSMGGTPTAEVKETVHNTEVMKRRLEETQGSVQKAEEQLKASRQELARLGDERKSTTDDKTARELDMQQMKAQIAVSMNTATAARSKAKAADEQAKLSHAQAIEALAKQHEIRWKAAMARHGITERDWNQYGGGVQQKEVDALVYSAKTAFYDKDDYDTAKKKYEEAIGKIDAAVADAKRRKDGLR